jgi:hypothetical protein
MSPRPSVLLDGVDFEAFHRACSALIGSISVTTTRAP